RICATSCHVPSHAVIHRHVRGQYMAIIDLKNETPLSLAQAARMLPPGRRGRPVTLSCVLRWVIDGIKIGGALVRLDAMRMGGRWITSVQALERFAQAQTPKFGGAPAPRTAGRRQRGAAKAARELEKLGI